VNVLATFEPGPGDAFALYCCVWALAALLATANVLLCIHMLRSFLK